MSNLLFICCKNQWRSPTAEKLFKDHAFHKARSAGTSEKANIKVNQKLLLWADVIFVMERRHKALIKQRFSAVIAEKPITVLDIEDNYHFGDEELVEISKQKLCDYL